MNWKTWIPLMLAIVLGVVAAKIARDVLSQNRTVAPQSINLANVVVANTDLYPGHEVRTDDLAETQLAAELIPADAYRDASLLTGRVVETRIVKGQTIVDALLAPTGTGAGLQAQIPPGMRAVTIEVNEFSGVAGLLTPGCRVDVIATIQGERQIARTIVQNVKVTAVGSRTVIPPKDPKDPNQLPEITRSITVLATLKDAEAIELAASTGRPRLVLRNTRDNEIASSEGVSLTELRGADRNAFWLNAVKLMSMLPSQPIEPDPHAKANEKKEPEKINIKVIRGTQETTYTFDAPETPESMSATDVSPATGR